MTYRNIDTNEIWTKEEIEEIYNSEANLLEEYETFEEYLEHLLDLGRQGVGGVVEA